MQPIDKFFILGCPRSGTTMVQQALNRHSRIAIPPETKFFFSFFGHSQACQARHLERLNADLDIDLPAPPAPVRTLPEGRAFYEQMAQQYLQRLGKPDVTHFGEKTPEHTGHLPRILQMFPTAKIIVLYRDGRDVAHSLTKVPWMSSDLYVNFLVWLYYQRIVQKAMHSGHPNLHFARYEDIVADPERELGGMLRFLGLPYQRAVAEGHGNSEGIPQREYGWKGRALQRITTARAGLFQQELSEDQVAILERLGHRALTSLGYPLLTDGTRSLSLTFWCGLAWNLARLAWRLPWHSVAHEFVGHPVLCPSAHAPQRPVAVARPWEEPAVDAALESSGIWSEARV
jgi:hypothetical protein